MSSSLIGPRLKALRDARRLTQDDVAHVLGIENRQTISQIESGERQLKADELLRLVERFGVPLDYFTDPFRLEGEGSFSWRQTGRTETELRDYERIAGSWIAMFRHQAPRIGRLPQIRRPKLPLTKRSSFEDAQEQGERVWRELQLGDVPAARLAQAMEENLGILVLMVDAIDGVSGAACRLHDLDAVLVNRNEVAGRRHFDLAHELFHIMTWEEMPPDYSEDARAFGGKRNRVEQLADNFASALLMPSEVLARFGDWMRLGAAELAGRLNEIAERLQVTAQALKWRLVSIGSIVKAVADSILDDWIRNNGQVRSQAPTPAAFSPAFLDVLGKSLDQGLVSKRRIAKVLGIDLDDLPGLFAAHGLACPEGV